MGRPIDCNCVCGDPSDSNSGVSWSPLDCKCLAGTTPVLYRVTLDGFVDGYLNVFQWGTVSSAWESCYFPPGTTPPNPPYSRSAYLPFEELNGDHDLRVGATLAGCSWSWPSPALWETSDNGSACIKLAAMPSPQLVVGRMRSRLLLEQFISPDNDRQVRFALRLLLDFRAINPFDNVTEHRPLTVPAGQHIISLNWLWVGDFDDELLLPNNPPAIDCSQQRTLSLVETSPDVALTDLVAPASVEIAPV